MERRHAIRALAAGFSALVLQANAQAKNVRRIGFLGLRSRSTASKPDPFFDAFVEGMRELGYVEGENLVIEWRFAEGRYERLPALARELVQKNVELIVAHGTPGTAAARLATQTIPIVTPAVADPVASGFAKSLARPGGNVTGLVTFNATAKHLELLKTIKPSLSRVAVLTNPDNEIFESLVTDARTSGESMGVKVMPAPARNANEIERAFGAMTKEGVDAVIVLIDPVFTGERQRIAALSIKTRIPAMAVARQYADAGCLMSYGENTAENFKRVAVHVDKIFKGARPGDLPFEQPTKLELVINKRTAKAMGIAIPTELLLRADQVIE